MTQKELTYVKTIADEKSIAKAAKKLYLAQPSLSQSIQRLEESLGISLFNRTRNGVSLTYAGEQYYQMAVQILKIYQDFETEISDINQLQTGRIQIGITNHLGSIVLPKILPDFHHQYPNIDIYVTEATTAQLEHKLLTGEIDFSVMHAPASDIHPQLDYNILSRDPFLLVCSKDNPLHQKVLVKNNYPYPVVEISELKKQSFIMISKEQRIRQVTDHLLKRASISHPKIILTVKNHETAQRLALAGMGVTLIPTEYAKLTTAEYPDSYLSIDLKYQAYWDMCITTAKGTYLPNAARHLIERIQQL